MPVRRLLAALTIPCACLASGAAAGQDRSVYGPVAPAPVPAAAAAPAGDDPARLPIVEAPASAAPISMLESWSLGEGAELGIGRFRVNEIARPRTNLERERAPLQLAPGTDPIAGAGLVIRFR